MSDEAPEILAADGRPARPLRAGDERCPECRADRSRRVRAAGFGNPPVICGVCGYTFPRGTDL